MFDLLKKNKTKNAQNSARRDPADMFNIMPWGMNWAALPEWLSDEEQWYPKTDIEEKKDKYIIKAQLPGVEEGDIELELNGNTLSLHAERSEDQEEEGSDDGNRVVSSSHIAYSRSFTLTEDADAENISAKYKNGMLNISVPKLKGKESSRSIKINQ